MTQTKPVIAAVYDANGQRTGQTTSWFSWWCATNENGEIIDFPKVQQEVERTGKIRIIGEAATTGRRIHDSLPAKRTNNGSVEVTLEEGAEVVLYPSCQLTLSASIIFDYWISFNGDYVPHNELEFKNDEFCTSGEELLEIRGRLSDKRETTVTATNLIRLDGYSEGTIIAVGGGQRYILSRPTGYATVLAHEAHRRAAV